MKAVLSKMKIKLDAVIDNLIKDKIYTLIKCMPKKQRTWPVAYVILLSDEVHDFMTQLQINILEQYGVNSGLTAAPHITLKLGFDVACLEPHAKYFDCLVKDIEPFEICINGVGKFDEGIIYFNVKINPHLEKLRRRILRDLHDQFGVKPYQLEGDQYHFHATLAYGLSKNDFALAYEGLKNMHVHMCFMMKTMSLFCHTGDHWISYKQATITDKVK
jgi:2'-5' RNA ligase